jgi:ABC-type lipoprotein export system ATPase subunit
MSYLELRDVSKVYGEGAAEVRALQRVDLSVEAGSLVAVMGASGSGKSTLLTIAGSLEASRCPRCRATARRACADSPSATSSRTTTCWRA